MKPLSRSLEELVEVDRVKDKEAKEAANFRARLLGLMYETLLEQWFEKSGYEVERRDVRKGQYQYSEEREKKFAVDFILRRKSDGKRLVVEAKCWPSYNEGKLKTLNQSTLEKLMNMKGEEMERLRCFLRNDFLEKYTLKDEKLDGKILVWWDVEEEDIEKIKQQTGLSEIIALKNILKSEIYKFRKRLEKYEEWAKELFQALKGTNGPLQ